uniref:Lipoxygenase n=2 Tax=Chenopodium quinoa TaxID=63459 RepID=A0A803KUV7_CHEQI
MLTDNDGKELGEYAYHIKISNEAEFNANFNIPEDFGEVGAISITNEQKTEVFIKNIVLDLRSGKSEFTCNSWVASKNDDPQPRVFFSNKSYLPSQTPKGLVKLRKDDLLQLRGYGEEQEERKSFQRIYDYDTYDDLGDPEKSLKLLRPVLGGNEHPYPRRCRTGREKITIEGQTFETRLDKGSPYVPINENFSKSKEAQFKFKTIYSMLHAVIPTIKEKVFATPNSRFPFFTSIDLLYNEGINLPVNNEYLGDGSTALEWLHRIIKATGDLKYKILRFELPETFKRNRFSWLSDEEFGRQTLAGMNPLSIKRVTNWPIMSNLDPKIYGNPESALTTALVDTQINIMTVEEAIKEKRLFIIDYHDALLPFVNKVRKLENTTLYGSRTLFFLDDEQQTLKPLAIELTRPPNDLKPQWKEVYTPGTCATSEWLWKLAKVHALANDTGYHQLISH